MVFRLPISPQKLRPLVEVDTGGGAPGVSCVGVHKQTGIKLRDHLRMTMLKSSGKQQKEPFTWVLVWSNYTYSQL